MRTDLRFLKGVADSVWDRSQGALRYAFRFGNKVSYHAGNVTLSQQIPAAQQENSIVALFHPATETKRYELQRVRVSYTGGTGGRLIIQLRRVTSASGGTQQIPRPKDPGDPASSALVLSNGPAITIISTSASIVVGGSGDRDITFGMADIQTCKPWACRPGVAEGYCVTVTAEIAPSTGAFVLATFEWTEE